ncbi:hypothetical protein F5883DRAFT_656987 [Diaporthe sp. PMI_573]|nr:hypothetical protein F5883DRAFT_656987 [Diaporthaceae sp. PMI_573]
MNRFKPKAVRRSEAERQKAAKDFAREQAWKAAEMAENISAKCRAGIHGSHTRHNCLNMPCNYCKKEGHTATTEDWPAFMRKEAIPVTKQSYEGAHEAADQTSLNDYKIRRRDSRWFPESNGFSPHFHCPGMSSVDGETMEAEEGFIYPTPDIHFPDLKDTLTCLVQRLSFDELDDLKFMDYPALFRDMDYSIQHIVDKAISLVEPEVLGFQVCSFREAHVAQWLRTTGKSWSLEGGYVDGVLDDRNPKYARYYPGSNLRVIILLGLRAQKDILSVFKNTTPAQLVHHEQHLSGPYQLPLQGCTICVWILCHGRQVSRLFIAGPEPPNVGSKGKSGNAKLTATRNTFGLTAAVSGERIRNTFWDSACFFASLFSQARLANEGVEEPLSSTDLAPVFRNWLSYKHFTDNDIKDLEQIAGGMTRGLLQVVTILRHWVDGKASEEGASSRSRGYRGKYDGPTYEKVKELFFRVAGINSSAKTQPRDAATQTQDMNLGTEGQTDSEDGFLNSSTIDFMSGIISEIARYTPERVDEEYAELGLHSSQSSTPHPRLLSTGSGVSNGTDTGASPEKSSPATCTGPSTAAPAPVRLESGIDTATASARNKASRPGSSTASRSASNTASRPSG